MKQHLITLFLLLLISSPMLHAKQHRHGHHGMVLFTDGTSLYASHLPLYQSPHDYQLIYQIESKLEKQLLAALNKGMVTILPDQFDLNLLINGQSLSTKITAYQGHFERGGKHLFTDQDFTFKKQIFKRQLSQENIDTIDEDFFLIDLEKSDWQLAIHAINSRPSFDLLALLKNRHCMIKTSQNKSFIQLDKITSTKINQAKLLLDQCGENNILYFESQDFKDLSLMKLNSKAWRHGSADCQNNTDSAIEIHQYNQDTFILRQNKCSHYEAPFIYVLFGDEKILVLDTGASSDKEIFPLYATIQKLIKQHPKAHSKTPIIVAHSHSHSDHTAADAQFQNKANTTVIPHNTKAIQAFFKIDKWPLSNGKINLGERLLTIIPIPGHQSESIAIYDEQTQWLLTGDTFYPGRLYIKNWQLYKDSIKRLLDFSQKHHISAILGTHIEMTNQKFKDYAIGSTYQPDEASLVLTLDDLINLDQSLDELGQRPQHKIHQRFIIYPVD